MDDLAEYFSDKDRIKELEKQVSLLTSSKSKWKLKCEKLQGKQTIKVTLPSRSDNAKTFILAWHNREKSLTFKQIAEKCFLTHQDVKNISCKLRKEFGFV